MVLRLKGRIYLYVDLTEKEIEKMLQLVQKSMHTNRYELKKAEKESERFMHLSNSVDLKSGIVKKLRKALKENVAGC